MAAGPPLAVAFDVNETLFGLEPLRERLSALGLPGPALEWWFAVVLREGFALAATGEHRPFAEVGRAALGEVLESCHLRVPPDAAERVLGGFEELAPHPDVRPALEALADAGVTALTLTNGNDQVIGRLLERAGLRELVAHVLSVDGAGQWKPRPEPYRYAASVAGVAAGELALVAVHPWDVHGAARAGLVGAWVHREGRTWPGTFPPPEVAAPSLDGVVRRLLDRAAP